ncbi:hypothetical protein [Azospirillum halopraeferens]|uniref:hypothetical protein n=1 Tax=Azospirillum halopraeferens TaxID=34010 RepID=UPI0012EC3889|nr:hypothetical protein [Azospirillum halopraeferens]
MANAAYAVPSAAAFPAARGGFPVGERPDGRVLPKDGASEPQRTTGVPGAEEEPIVGRYPVIAFSFNADASKLVLLYRDPATGDTLSQIPSEVALKQYEEAQRKERDARNPNLRLVVGGPEQGSGEPGRPSGRRTESGVSTSPTAAGAPPPGTGGATAAPSPAVATSPVPGATSSPVSSPGGNGGRVDLVI